MRTTTLNHATIRSLISMGPALDKHRITIQGVNELTGKAKNGTYEIRLPRPEPDLIRGAPHTVMGPLCLIPLRAGAIAESDVDRNSYGYQQGGTLYQAAVDLAKALAAAL